MILIKISKKGFNQYFESGGITYTETGSLLVVNLGPLSW